MGKDAKQLRTAFEKNEAMIRKGRPAKIEDLDYLKMQSVLSAFGSREPQWLSFLAAASQKQEFKKLFPHL